MDVPKDCIIKIRHQTGNTFFPDNTYTVDNVNDETTFRDNHKKVLAQREANGTGVSAFEEMLYFFSIDEIRFCYSKNHLTVDKDQKNYVSNSLIENMELELKATKDEEYDLDPKVQELKTEFLRCSLEIVFAFIFLFWPG